MKDETARCPDCGRTLPGDGRVEDLCPQCLLELALEESSAPEEETLGGDDSWGPDAEGLTRGRILGNRYGVRMRLGRGGMGEVWRAFDLKLRVDVALKTVRPDLAEQPRVLEALRQEVRAAREVVSPNVCRVHDLQEIDGRELVTMEYVDGTTLGELLAERGPLDLQEAREIAAQFLAGLEAIHRAGLVHRDIKPENIMRTRTGRVVVMDFGIAHALETARAGTVVGTPAYMALEQSRGEAVDARADVFSAGMVLAEMLAPGERDGYRALRQGLRREPPEVPESPWRGVIEGAVASRVERRYATASALARALEEVTIRVEGAEDVTPYPGLTAFTEHDREYFFGRELEAEAIWRRIRKLHLLALVGPSGAGKTSFLRAGLLASMPQSWSHVICTPGEAPFTALRQALAPQLAGDSGAIQALADLEDPEALVSAAARWRGRTRHTLLIVDQFEELFTLNPPDVQAGFAQLLGSLAVDADIHVLLSLRDDFLIHCHAHEALEPILSELTLLGPPTGAALRRAVVQPALKCGYRFEGESLVDEMLSEVAGERAALPLLAFGAEQLWERRDRDRGLLTRDAYGVIGGVAGALAQHAELTLERIGTDRAPIVRELFRNLVTSQGTRAVREREELLSVFQAGAPREAAGAILDLLVGARLLTTYGMETGENDGTSQRVEIVHESLLSAWPRLVRWQAQDVDGARLRDDLRQAARRWQERDRPHDLLWSGSAFREFRLWRERYPGRLSEVEEAFARASAAHAERARRRRRWAIGSAFVALLALAGAMGMLWRRSEAAREQAVAETRRAEASKLVLLGRSALEDDTSTALAYALRSLELTDTLQAREFAVEALWRGPTRLQLTDQDTSGFAFSPDGRRLARWRGRPPSLEVWPRGGAPPKPFPGEGQAAFADTPDAGPVMVSQPGDAEGDENRVLVRALGDWSLLRTLELPALLGFSIPLRRPVLFTVTSLSPGPEWWRVVMKGWPLVEGEPWEVTRLESPRIRLAGLVGDPDGRILAYATHDNEIKVVTRDSAGTSRTRVVGSHDAPLCVGPEGVSIQVHPDGDTIVTTDESGEIRFHRISAAEPSPVRVIHVPGSDSGRPQFTPDGTLMSLGVMNDVDLWELDGPPDAEPIALPNVGQQLNASGFSPDGRWLVTAQGARTSLWPVARTYPRVLRAHTALVGGLAFDPHGRWLATASLDASVRVWPLDAGSGASGRVVFEDETRSGFTDLDVDPEGRFLMAANQHGKVWIIPLDGGEVRSLSGFEGGVAGVAVGPKGRLVAAAGGGQYHASDRVVRVWDLESGAERVLDAGLNRGMDWWFEFTADGRILTTEVGGGVRLWNVADGTSEMLHSGADRLTRGSRQSTVCTGRADRLDEWLCHDLATGAARKVDLSAHAGAQPGEFALDPSGQWFVSGDSVGHVRVGPISGGPPHLLLGHDHPITELEVSPDGAWVAAGAIDGVVRIWPMPHGSQPFHLLPRDALLDRLRALTNLRAVEDAEAASGYRIEAGPFPGWETVPTW